MNRPVITLKTPTNRTVEVVANDRGDFGIWTERFNRIDNTVDMGPVVWLTTPLAKALAEAIQGATK